MKSGKTFSTVLNYNMVDEEMVFDQNGVYMVLDKPNEIDTVFLQNRKFIPVEKAFHEVLVTGSVSLYIQHKCRWSAVASKSAYGMTSQTNASNAVSTMHSGNQVRNLEVPDNLTVSPANIYWIKIKNEMHKFTSERQLLKLLPEIENDLKDYLKKNKLNLRKKEDVFQIGLFCNQKLK